MNIRLSQPQDLPTLMAIFHEAQRTIADLGIDQWQNGYPSEPVVLDDIALGRSYVAEREGIICGTFVLVEAEPTYDTIYEGAWSAPDYIAIHRVAVPVAYRGSGVCDAIISYAAAYAKARDKSALRIDTHRGNLPMRRMLEKRAFAYRGVILLADGAPRVAYEKVCHENGDMCP